MLTRSNLADHAFCESVDSLDDSLERLLRCPLYRSDTLPRQMPIGGVYLFSESSRPMYVGRSQARLRDRIRDHGRLKTEANASFAKRLVFAKLEALGPDELDRRFAKPGPLFSAREYAREIMCARRRISAMEIQFVEERHPIRRALLEIYAAVALNTPHNDF